MSFPVRNFKVIVEGMRKNLLRRRSLDWLSTAAGFAFVSSPLHLQAQQTSVSVWDAAEFRIWGFVPYWSGESGTSVVNQLNILSNAGAYNHVSDVLYFGGVQPDSTGGLWYYSNAASTLNTLASHAAQHGFRLHMSLFDVAPGSTVDESWTSIVSTPAYRRNFVDNVTWLLETHGMSGFNFDWERPNTAEKWGNYTQLARELGEVIKPMGLEVSVCDFGFTDPKWDDSPLFDARVYDQLFIMGYHYPAYSSDLLNNNYFANGKLALTGQGAEKAFRDEQLTLGIGTWGADGPATVRLRTFAEEHPALAYDVGSISGTYTAINGTDHTGTWTIESRQQVREKTQLALDRGMPGMFTWTLHYDALNELGLHRVMHHYAVFKRGVPDLNLDGRVDAADAHILADNMGSILGSTGTNTAAQLDNFYLHGNWEAGDHNGNGFVRQADADWLAGRFAALGVDLPNRLAYTGEFEAFGDSRGLSGRWRAWREAAGNLRETGNFTQHPPGHFSWSGMGGGSSQISDSVVTIRNQNATERLDALNMLDRIMVADLAEPIDLGRNETTYFTFLVRQNTGPLLSSQLSSSNRTLSLEFLDEEDASLFGLLFRGAQEEFAIQSEPGGPEVMAVGFQADETYLVVGRISGNGTAANTLQLSWFPDGTEVDDFTRPGFDWMLTAQSSAGFDPLAATLRFTSSFEANYTVSNIWILDAIDSYSAWAAYYENLHGASPGTLSDATGDADGDGMGELLEYALEGWGADPLAPERSMLPRPETLDETLVLDYPRDSGKTGITARALVSSDLFTWHSAGDPGAPAGFSDVELETPGPIAVRRASIPLSADNKVFLRLEVTVKTGD